MLLFLNAKRIRNFDGMAEWTFGTKSARYIVYAKIHICRTFIIGFRDFCKALVNTVQTFKLPGIYAACCHLHLF